ncbi:RidA family protein [Streptomyces paludis]|uniref:RidA family protein n=1 Tax=Streptomyces paludis TaxID=2282738 RepID=A0A345HU24_9ACTN|nr:RidA family protein [Streptomyces paludis]AXG80198.1 RidA family protein [Streptomyces paludis]
MAHRMTVPGLFPPPDYAHTAVVETGRRLAFLAGSVPLDQDGKLVGPDDFVAQTEQVLANLESALAAVGCGPGDVVATTVSVATSDPADLSRVWEVVRAGGLRTGPHTSTLLGVACLGYTGQLVEITAVAEVPPEL